VITEPECEAGSTEDVIASRHVGDLDWEIINVVHFEADVALVNALFVADAVVDAALEKPREAISGCCTRSVRHYGKEINLFWVLVLEVKWSMHIRMEGRVSLTL
jgi:hypothetical protein